jgi:putative addiction module component (TIGR02574 family)
MKGQAMTVAEKKALESLMKLPRGGRKRVVVKVLESLHAEGRQEQIDKAWEKEIVRRLDEIDSGKAKLVPWEVVKEKLERRQYGR